jgi:hypothetical protein
LFTSAAYTLNAFMNGVRRQGSIFRRRHGAITLIWISLIINNKPYRLYANKKTLFIYTKNDIYNHYKDTSMRCQVWASPGCVLATTTAELTGIDIDPTQRSESPEG